MTKVRRTVFIPLVGGTNSSHQFLEIYADRQKFGDTELDTKALDKDWDFICAELRYLGLYDNALQAVSAVRKIGLKRPFGALFQLRKKYTWLDGLRLHSATVIDCKGESSQFGLALCLLLNGSQSPIDFVIATGKLSSSKGSDVKVEPVFGVQDKLQLILEKCRNDSLPRHNKLYCFTPIHFFKDEELLRVDKLSEVQLLKDVGVEVRPVERLSEAAALLQANKTPFFWQDKILLSTLSVLSTALFLTFIYSVWLLNPITIKAVAVKHKAEPFLVCTNRDESLVSYYDLEHDGSTPLLPVLGIEDVDYNLGLGWKLNVAKTFFTDLYYVGLFDIGSQSGIKIIDRDSENNQLITVQGDAELEWYWPMQEEVGKSFEEEKLLFIALQRIPIKVDEIYQGLDKRFPETKELSILQVRDYLVTLFPGSYSFIYKTVFNDPSCIEY